MRLGPPSRRAGPDSSGHAQTGPDEPGPGRAGPSGAQSGIKTFLAVVLAHFVGDCCGGIWPVYKKLAGLDLTAAGLISTLTLMIGTASEPVFGIWADRGRRRLLIVLGTLMTFSAMLLGPLSAWMAGSAIGLREGYVLMFLLMMITRFGQDMFHPAGAGLAGSFSSSRRSMLVAVFVAVGSIGFGLSQLSFSGVYKLANRHTELLLVPFGLAWVLIAAWCRPARTGGTGGLALRAVLADLGSARRHLLVLFTILALSAALNIGMQFLLPEFVAARGYPRWLADGGAFAFLILGSVLMMVPAGHLAERVGRRFVLIPMMVLAGLGYYLIVLLPQTAVPVFIAACMLGGAFLGTVNPLGIAFGQHLSPRNISMVSAIMMGMAWCVGSMSPSVVGPLAKRVGPINALVWLGTVNLVIIALGFLLPGGRAEQSRPDLSAGTAAADGR